MKILQLYLRQQKLLIEKIKLNLKHKQHKLKAVKELIRIREADKQIEKV